MWLAFLIVALLIVYGSIFPFDFHAGSFNGELLTAFLHSWKVRSSPSDIFGNVALFVPFSAVGMLAFPRFHYWRRVVLICVSGLVVATVSQLAQYYVPVRIPALRDVLWNVIGIALGLVLGAVALGFLSRARSNPTKSDLGPVHLLLIGLWLALRLFPFLPSTDLQVYEASVQPLLASPDIKLSQLLLELSGWLVVGMLIVDSGIARRGALILLALGVATFSLEVIIVANSLSWTDVAALASAIAVLAMLPRWSANPAIVPVSILAIALVYAGLEPFHLRKTIAHFGWVPFGATINGYLFFTIKVIVAKLFFYSALVWFLGQIRRRSPLFAVTAATGLVVGIEVVQTFIASHTPEITDPLIVLICALIVYTGNSVRVHDHRPIAPVGSSRG